AGAGAVLASSGSRPGGNSVVDSPKHPARPTTHASSCGWPPTTVHRSLAPVVGLPRRQPAVREVGRCTPCTGSRIVRRWPVVMSTGQGPAGPAQPVTEEFGTYT